MSTLLRAAVFVFRVGVAFIGALLLWCCPPAIFAKVSKSAVDTVYRAVNWSFAHIFKESIELQPFLADSDSLRPVFGKVLNLRVGAASNHRAPRSVSGRFALADPMSVATMPQAHLSHSFVSQASAIRALAVANVSSSNRLDSPALAAAQIADLISETRAFANDCQEAESLIDRDRQFSHTRLYTVC